MDWIEKHSVLIMLIIAMLGWFAQFVTARHQLKGLLKWQATVDVKLASIDSEINQIKISGAREIVRTDTLAEDVAHIKRSLDDLREMFIMALSSGTIKFKTQERN